MAGAVAAALMTIVGLAVVLIWSLARPITFVLAPGIVGDERFDLAVSLVRITTVGTGFAVLSAWCLGVLNSHRRFFVSYAAPVLWNAVQIGALVVAWILVFDLDGVARALAWGVAGGGLAQLLVQPPAHRSPGPGPAAQMDTRPCRPARDPSPVRAGRAGTGRGAGLSFP